MKNFETLAPSSPRQAPLSVRALARLYWPDTPERTARRYFRRCIRDNRALLLRLRAAGYDDHTRILTPRMVGIIYDAWKPP